MKKPTTFIIALICFINISLVFSNETINMPPNCNAFDDYFQCVYAEDIEFLVNDVNNYTIQNLEACTDTCDSNPFVSVTSNMHMDNFNYYCSNTGYIDIEYTLIDACSNTETIIIRIHFEDFIGPDTSNCDLTDTTFNIPCTDPNVLTVLQAWNNENIAELETCAIDECGFSVFVDSFFNTSFICIDNSLTVTYYVSDECGNLSAITATAFLEGYSESYISGNNILDLNTDGCDVNSDPVFPNLMFHVDGDSRTYYSNYTSSYTLGLQDGTHIITPEVYNPTYFTVAPASVSVDFPIDTSPFNQDFCITPNGIHNDLEVYLWSSGSIPGFNTTIYITYKNVGNTVINGDLDFNFNDDVMDFSIANPMEATASLGNLTWNYSNLQPFETRSIQIIMQLNTPTDASFPLNAGDVLTYDATANPVATDETPDNNTYTHNRTVVNSYDPNDITCLEGKEIEVSQVGKYVHYRIRFENNGTANATHVRVRDVMDLTTFDISTLIPIDGSHSFVTDIKNANEVDFIFENINLPFDDANNDGYVAFKIKTLATLVVGDTFSNQAGIYFDFNPAIDTNIETTVIIENDLSVGEYNVGEVNFYPNPVENELFLNSENQIKQITIYTISGQLIEKLTIEDTANFQNKIDVSKLSKGLYFIKLHTTNSEITKKIIKL